MATLPKRMLPVPLSSVKRAVYRALLSPRPPAPSAASAAPSSSASAFAADDQALSSSSTTMLSFRGDAGASVLERETAADVEASVAAPLPRAPPRRGPGHSPAPGGGDEDSDDDADAGAGDDKSAGDDSAARQRAYDDFASLLSGRRAAAGLKPGAWDPASAAAAGVVVEPPLRRRGAAGADDERGGSGPLDPQRLGELEQRSAYLRNFWYAAALSQNVKPGKVHGVDMLGGRVVLFRDAATGRVRALDDACPHRGAPLSGGWLTAAKCGHGAGTAPLSRAGPEDSTAVVCPCEYIYISPFWSPFGGALRLAALSVWRRSPFGGALPFCLVVGKGPLAAGRVRAQTRRSPFLRPCPAHQYWCAIISTHSHTPFPPHQQQHTNENTTKQNAINAKKKKKDHGWAFDGDGRLRDVPSAEPGRWPKRPILESYPVEERGGFVWLFFGDARLPADERPPIPHAPELDAPPDQWRAVYGEIEFDCPHWSVFENAIDMAHIHFLHSGSFGNPDAPRIEGMAAKRESCFSVASEFVIHNKPVSKLWEWTSPPDNSVPVVARAMLPSTSSVQIALARGVSMITFVNTVPIDERRAVNRFCLVRNFALSKVFDGQARRAMHKILEEDKVMVERVRPDRVRREYSLGPDAPQVAFRKLRQEWVDLGYATKQGLGASRPAISAAGASGGGGGTGGDKGGRDARPDL